MEAGDLMTDTVPPLTDTIPPRRTRAVLKLRAFIYHPAVMFGEAIFLTGVIAAVIVVVVTRGWL